MSELEKYNKAFLEVFEMEGEKELENLADWDSASQLNLISELEDVFDIMLDTKDILAFSSYEKGKQIMLKYGVDLNSK